MPFNYLLGVVEAHTRPFRGNLGYAPLFYFNSAGFYRGQILFLFSVDYI
jgi:hypothetical protein